MRIAHKRGLRTLLIAATFSAGLSAPVSAQQAVTCVNCSTIVQQLLDYARQLEQLQQEIQTAQNTLNFFLNAVQNTASLPNTVYRDLTADIQRIENIANQAQMLGGQTGAMIGNLSPSTGYPLAGISSWTQQLVNEDAALATAMRSAAQVLNLQPAQLQADATTLSSLQSQAMAATGRQQVLQSIAGINATVGQQIGKQQATLAAAMQALATYDIAQADRQALLEAVGQQRLLQEEQVSCQALQATGSSIPCAQ